MSSLRIARKWNGEATTTAPYQVQFELSPSTGDLTIIIDAPFHNDPAPYAEQGRFPELNEFEAVEVFITSFPDGYSDTRPYMEIQVGPHGHYMIVYFISEGDWENQDQSIELDNLPRTKIHKDIGRWTSNISIPAYLLPEPKCGSDLSVSWLANAFAIHGDGENREYLAHSAVEGKKPNFHQLKSFVQVTLYETAEVREKVDRKISVAHELVNGKGDAQGAIQKKIGFSPSTASQDGPGNYQNTTARLLEDLANMQGSSSSGKGESGRRTPVITVEEVAKRLREKELRAHNKNPEYLELDEKFQRQIQADEFVVMHGFVWKRKGLSYKQRMLILTSKPRLLYFTKEGVFKGFIPWGITKPLLLTKKNDKKFDMEVFDKTRTYHLSDSAGGSERWINAINEFIDAQKDYVATKLS